MATVARYFVAIPVVVCGFERFMHADQFPGVPLELLTPRYVDGRAARTYVAAVV